MALHSFHAAERVDATDFISLCVWLLLGKKLRWFRDAAKPGAQEICEKGIRLHPHGGSYFSDATVCDQSALNRAVAPPTGSCLVLPAH
ncbi:hypothetical protein LDENG_00242800 [Lucifuga dentata]|nr:hypothetical protein LDENG_00242800 [Lucifuga dentata]